MRRVFWVLLLGGVTMAAPAWACHRHHGSHGHVGAGGLAFSLFDLFSIGVRVHSHAACDHRPVVVEAPPPQVVYVPAPAPQVAAVMVAPSEPPLVVAPSPPPVVVAPVPVAAPAEAPKVKQSEGPALIGIKYAPGVSGALRTGDTLGVAGISPSHSAGVELRLGRYFALRSDLEFRSSGRSYDVAGGKVWIAPASWGLRPYGSVSLSRSISETTRSGSWGVVGAAGLDLNLGKHFFLELEGRYRVLPEDCCRDTPQVTALVGGGIAFF